MNVKLQALTRSSRTVKLSLINNMHLFEYDSCDKIKFWSDIWSTKRKRLLARTKKELKSQSASGVSTKRTEPKDLSKTAEGLKPISQKHSVTKADNRFQGNLEPTITPESEKCSLSERKVGSETRAVIEILHILLAFFRRGSRRQCRRAVPTQCQSVPKWTALSTIQELRKSGWKNNEGMTKKSPFRWRSQGDCKTVTLICYWSSTIIQSDCGHLLESTLIVDLSQQ